MSSWAEVGSGSQRATKEAVTAASTTDLSDTGVRNAGTFGTTAPQLVVYRAVVVNGANAGNVQLRWAQINSNATATTVRANSVLRGTRAA